MSRFIGVLARASLLAGVALMAAPARAHINLLEPAARAPGRPDTRLRREPCGQIPNMRREDGVSVFRPGETITVAWEVYVQHQSYFRLSFDADGDDSFSTRPSSPSDFEADDLTQLEPGEGEFILDYMKDLAGDVDGVERSVTLPDLECDRCTLQLTQFTYGLPVSEAIYYQCADLVLDDGDGVIEASAGGAAGSAGAAGGSGSATAGAGSAVGASDPDDDATGCSLPRAAGSRRSSSSGPWLAGFGLSLALGRRWWRRGAQGAGSDSIHSRKSST
ncbi:MAG TPA: SCE4755 family polysaccharide monooxygenase-like protein [Polyangiaceae bacterium]|nr:SCE4755 family polysaccharide monooxygenase-like protein [Polyangiaceae bacterium]